MTSGPFKKEELDNIRNDTFSKIDTSSIFCFYECHKNLNKRMELWMQLQMNHNIK